MSGGAADFVLAPPWDLVCLSPHFDDAALSAGGWLHRRAASGARVLVVTVCAAPPPQGPLSAFAGAHHRRWGAPAGGEHRDAARMTALRRAEDETALARLGVAGRWLDVPDAIYRRAPRGTGQQPAFLYTDMDALFGALDERERGLVEQIAVALGGLPDVHGKTQVLAPLCVGGHVDHRLVRAAAERWRGRSLAYYEDYPYARDPTALAAVVDGTDLVPERLPLSEGDVEAKVEAIRAYDSQLSTFWRDADDMAHEVRERASTTAAARDSAVGPLRLEGAAGAERVWQLPSGPPAA